MRVHSILLLGAVVALTGCAQAAAPAPKTDDEKALYALGVILSRNIQTFNFTDKELEMVKAGVSDGARDQSKLDTAAIEAIVPKLQELQTQRMTDATTKEDGRCCLSCQGRDREGRHQDRQWSRDPHDAGGHGATPVPEDMVKVHYTGKFVAARCSTARLSATNPRLPLTGVIPAGRKPCS